VNIKAKPFLEPRLVVHWGRVCLFVCSYISLYIAFCKKKIENAVCHSENAKHVECLQHAIWFCFPKWFLTFVNFTQYANEWVSIITPSYRRWHHQQPHRPSFHAWTTPSTHMSCPHWVHVCVCSVLSIRILPAFNRSSTRADHVPLLFWPAIF
jgi:hypothetical protein